MAQYIKNGAMNAPETGDKSTPYFLRICDIDHETTVYPEYNYFDNTGKTLYTPDHSMFILMRTRGVYLNNGHIYVHNFEQLYTKLARPLEKNNFYNFSANFAFHGSELNSEIKPPIEKKVLFTIDPPLKLQADTGISYQWYPENCVSDAKIRDPILLEYTDTMKVAIMDTNGCPLYENHIVSLNCEQIYPDHHLPDKQVYFKVDAPVVLTAEEGSEYHWQPSDNLSDSTIQNPVLLDFEDELEVYFINKYGCPLYQRFDIIAHCDSMYPEKLIYRLDTVVEEGAALILDTYYGDIKYIWEPPTDISCLVCPSPTVTPQSTTTYTATLADQFGCEHDEIFYIKIKMIIPNVITPNDDGWNDQFIIKGLPRGSSLSVFDKNGYLVYSKSPYGYGEWWDGTRKGMKVETGNYWYVIELPGEKTGIKGYVFVKQP